MLEYDPATQYWTCDVCGWRFRARTESIRAIRPGHYCPPANTREAKAAREAEAAEAAAVYRDTIGPSLPEKLGHYARALRAWRAAGYPVRSDAEVAAIVAICQACEKFEAGHCQICGCAVNERRWAVANKARMATETCPLGKW